MGTEASVNKHSPSNKPSNINVNIETVEIKYDDNTYETVPTYNTNRHQNYSVSPTVSARLSSPTSNNITYASSPSIPSPICKPKHTRTMSYSHVTNGITGTHISSKICKIAAKFWQSNIEILPMNEQLEIGCAIFFGALSSNKEMKKIMKTNLNHNNYNIEKISLKYLDMIGWLLRYLVTDNIDLYSLLIRLGKFHQNIGVKINHFEPMLESMHETFSYYFPIKYDIEVKYAMDEIFSLAAQIMTGQDLKNSSHLNDIKKTFEKPNDIDFLQDLRVCLKSTVGREYLYRYLQQTFCDEIPLFLQTISKFKSQLTAAPRFMIARDIIKTSIKSDATFTLNLSYECRESTLVAMEELEGKFITNEPLNINADFFDQIECEIYKLILDNHWRKFVYNMKTLHSKSFGL